MNYLKAAKFLRNKNKPAPSDYNPSLMMVVNATKSTSRRKVCKKEPETCTWIRGFQKGSVFFDIGACVGGFSLPAWHEGCSVYAFEPSFASFNALCRNIELNNADIVPIYTALTDETKIQDFAYKTTLDGESAHGGIHGEGFKLKIPTFRLDDFVKLFELPLPSYIKIDIDGGEYPLLEGAQETIKHAKSILIEGDDEEKIAQLLPGFTLVGTYRDGITCNFIFNRTR